MEPNYVVDFSNRMYKMAMYFIVVLAVAVIACAIYSFQSMPQNYPREISVLGEGKAYIKPDIAVVSFGVHSDAPKSQDAVLKNNEKMNAVIKAIKDLGIADEDIKTTLYNLNPMYGSEARPMMGGYPIFENKVIGYALDQQVEVKIRNFDKINDILDKATSAGATNVGNLQFSVDNPEKVQAEARALAITKAKEKAKNIAKSSGIKLGKLVNVIEGYNNYPTPMYAQGMGGASMKDSIVPQIQAGQQEIISNVTLIYQVR